MLKWIGSQGPLQLILDFCRMLNTELIQVVRGQHPSGLTLIYLRINPPSLVHCPSLAHQPSCCILDCGWGVIRRGWGNKNAEGDGQVNVKEDNSLIEENL